MLQTDIRYNLCNKYLVFSEDLQLLFYFFFLRGIPFILGGGPLFEDMETRVFLSSFSAIAPGTVKSQIGMSFTLYAGGYGLQKFGGYAVLGLSPSSSSSAVKGVPKVKGASVVQFVSGLYIIGGGGNRLFCRLSIGTT